MRESEREIERERVREREREREMTQKECSFGKSSTPTKISRKARNKENQIYKDYRGGLIDSDIEMERDRKRNKKEADGVARCERCLEIEHNEHFVECDQCENWLCRECSNLTQNEVTNIANVADKVPKLDFYCKKCKESNIKAPKEVERINKLLQEKDLINTENGKLIFTANLKMGENAGENKKKTKKYQT